MEYKDHLENMEIEADKLLQAANGTTNGGDDDGSVSIQYFHLLLYLFQCRRCYHIFN